METNCVMEWVFGYIVLLGILVLFVAIAICAIVWIRGRGQQELLKMKQDHEKAVEEMNWAQKMEWETKMSEKAKELDAIRKEYEERQKKIDELWNKRDQTPQIDLNRFALLHMLLTGSKEAVTPEILEGEVEKVKKSYEMIKDYVK